MTLAAPALTPYVARLTGDLARGEDCGLRVASLFCCAGGFDLGFLAAGFRISFANDIDAHAAALYATNTGHTPRVADVRDVRGVELGACDVVTAGFPCVTFSMSGGRLGLHDDVHGKLYLELQRLLHEAQPRLFIAENVKGILSANEGAALRRIVYDLGRAGYRMRVFAFNAADYGVPSTRERVLMIGTRHDLVGVFVPKLRRRARVGLRAAIDDLAPGEIIGSIGESDGDRHVRSARASATGKYGGTSRYRTPEEPAHTLVAHGPGHLLLGSANREQGWHLRSAAQARGGRPTPGARLDFRAYRPLRAADEPTVTLTSKGPAWSFYAGALPLGATPLGSGMYMRAMTVRECARVQSFPDWCFASGSRTHAYSAIGNSVPPLVAREVALSARAFLESAEGQRA